MYCDIDLNPFPGKQVMGHHFGFFINSCFFFVLVLTPNERNKRSEKELFISLRIVDTYREFEEFHYVTLIPLLWSR